MSTSTLPVLTLPHPSLLLPAGRIVLTLSRPAGETLLGFVQQSDVAQPVIAVVPIVTPSSESAPEQTLLTSQYGVAAKLVRLIRPTSRAGQQPFVVTLLGLTRICLPEPLTLHSRVADEVAFRDVVHIPSEPEKALPAPDVDTFKTAAQRLVDRLAKDLNQPTRRDTWVRLASLIEEVAEQRTLWLADVLVSAINADYQDKLEFLATTDPHERLKRATALCIKQTSIMEVNSKITSEVNETLSKQQKEFYLRQQLAAIQKELNALHPSAASSSSELDDDEQQDADDLADLKRKIEALEHGSEERRMAVREWRRMKRIQPSSVEHGVIRSYLEWLVAIPWSSPATAESVDALKDPKFLSHARQQLDSDHFGLDKIKRRLIEYLAVVRLKALALDQEQALEEASPVPVARKGKKAGVKGPILLFVGPPGVGKTSLGQSIARALDRPFQRISLGGVRDEAEIRGHRRTYVASGPGAIVQALRKAGRPDPVILLDEIDKVGHSSFHGDPSAALLEVLDPEQNQSFNDHYINVPIDLSRVLFICTSNTLDTIAPPLLDRCETIQLSGYTHDEKLHIASRYLLPKQLTANAMDSERLTICRGTMRHIVSDYTHEAGVRSLERAIGAVVRYKAVQWAESHGDDAYRPAVEAHELEQILGVSHGQAEERERDERRGLVYGLVVTGLGEGGIMPVETTSVPGSGRLKLTGSLGEVIKESAEIALSWVKTHAYELYITKTRGQDPLKWGEAVDVHMHLPAGAQKKDGPSAGIAMTCALVSLLTGLCVPTTVAMTGEITLRGRVTPVGGIKEKVLGAHRAQVTKVILPWANRRDVEHDVAPEIRKDMQFVFVRTVEEALIAAFGNKLGWRTQPVLVESRL